MAWGSVCTRVSAVNANTLHTSWFELPTLLVTTLVGSVLVFVCVCLGLGLGLGVWVGMFVCVCL